MNQPFSPPVIASSSQAEQEREAFTFEDGAFRRIFNHSPYGKIIVNNAGLMTAVNEQGIALFGYERDELIGEPIEMLLPERFRSDHVARRVGFTNAPSPRSMGKGSDLTGLRKDGIEFPLEIGLTPVTTKHGNMTCAAIQDITERQRTERHLREVNAQLEEFTYVASHDLRSPIRGISNLIEFIREDFEEGQIEATLKNIDRMETRVHAVEKLIDDLLTYARAGRRAVEVETTSLHQILSDILAIEDIPEGFSVTVDASDEPFEGARTPLTTVLRNLISNAIKHHDQYTGKVTVCAHLSEDACVIDVTDDGPGIPDTARERVFRLFQTLKASERGSSGLGLAIAQRLATGHGGELTLMPSITERGTTFRVSWPRFTRTDLNA